MRLFALMGALPDPSTYETLWNSGTHLSGCTTDAMGTCSLGAPSPGNYELILRWVDPAGRKIVYSLHNVGAEDFVNDLALKDLELIKVVRRDGSLQYSPGRTQVVTGSKLELVYPDFSVWEPGAQAWLYPVIMTSDSEWTVDACAQVPSGYTIAGVYDAEGNLLSSSSCHEAFLAGETKVVAFEVRDLQSPPPHLRVDIRTSHHGREWHGALEMPGARRGRDIP